MLANQYAPPRGARYVRHVAGADFSLEANTDAALEADHFYLLRNGSVLMESSDYSCVESAYKGLCREYWEAQLEAEGPRARLSSAWGLLGLDPCHPAATAVIKRDGTPADCLRAASMVNRQRALERYAAGTGRSPRR